jgi:hypothetical protein
VWRYWSNEGAAPEQELLRRRTGLEPVQMGKEETTIWADMRHESGLSDTAYGQWEAQVDNVEVRALRYVASLLHSVVQFRHLLLHEYVVFGFSWIFKHEVLIGGDSSFEVA